MSRTSSPTHNMFVKSIAIVCLLNQLTPVTSQCSGTTLLLTGSGSLSSPNYPYSYPNNAFCQWRLTASSGVVRITIPSYATESSFDYINIYDGISSSSTRIASLTGVSYTTATYQSSQTYMFVSFQSDSSGTNTGFTATFQSTSVITQCSTTPVLLTGSGSLSSPNYPYSYPNNAFCQWRLTASYGVVQITITSYDTESTSDYIYICDGSSASSVLLATLSGVSYTSSTYRSSQTNMYVLFTSDSTITYGGFTATFLSTNVISQCGTTPLHLTGNGTLSSPNYPYSYPNNANCQWQLTASYGVVQITFTSYVTESTFDLINIYDGSSASSSLLASLSGFSYTSSTYWSSQANMYVSFSSDSSGTYGGFIATFQSTNDYDHNGGTGGIEHRSFIAIPIFTFIVIFNYNVY